MTPTPIPPRATPVLTPTPVGEKPQYGGIVNYHDYTDPVQIDPHATTVIGDLQMSMGVLSSIIKYDPRNPFYIAPDLAERWEQSADGKVFTFFLRKNVVWHDGTPFTARDVKVSIERVLGIWDPAFSAPRCGSLLKPLVDKMEVVDDYTVRFHLKFATPLFIPSIASSWCKIASASALERYKNLSRPESLIGTGPFALKRYERGVVFEWEKNRRYFEEGLPYLDGVRHYILPDVATQLAGLRTGRLHIAPNFPGLTPSQAQQVVSARGKEVVAYRWTVNNMVGTQLNTRVAPFNDIETRRAIHLALNRQEVVEKIFEGIGFPCTVLDPVAYGDYALPMEEVLRLPGCRPDKTADWAEARRIVQQKYPGGLELEVLVRRTLDFVPTAELVTAQLQALGIRARLQVLEPAAGLQRYGRGEFTIIGTQSTSPSIPDPSAMFTESWVPGGALNFTGWEDKTFMAMHEDAIRALDVRQRQRIVQEMQRYLLTKDMAWLVLGWRERYFIWDVRVKGFVPGPSIYEDKTFTTVWLSP